MSNTVTPISKRELLAYQADVKGAIFRQIREIFSRLKQSGFTQKDLAIKIGMNEGQLSRRLRGDYDLRLETLSDLARGLDCRIDVKLTPLSSTSVFAADRAAPAAVSRSVGFWEASTSEKYHETIRSEMLKERPIKEPRKFAFGPAKPLAFIGRRCAKERRMLSNKRWFGKRTVTQNQISPLGTKKSPGSAKLSYTHCIKWSGATMSDQQVPTEPAEGDEDESDNRILEAFGRKSSFGALQFLFEFWPAWMFDKGKRFAPICRIIIGDEDDGSVLIDKTVLITGLLHLAGDLTSAVAFNIRRASELPGFVMDSPGGESHVLELIDDLEGQLKEIRGMVERNNLFAAVEDDEHEQ